MKWIEYCIRKARRRNTSQRYRLHSVLVRGGSVICEGENLPVTDFALKCIKPHAEEWIGLHAEVATIRKAKPNQLKGAVLYVGGVTHFGSLILSKPCCWCSDILKETGIKAVVWHDKDGRVGKRSLRQLIAV